VIFKAILNGCAKDIAAQAEELNGFIHTHLSPENATGSSILFYSKEAQREALLDLVPTKSVKLVHMACYQPENALEALVTIERGETTHLYLFPSGFFGDEMVVRLAFRLKGSSLVQVKQIHGSGPRLLASKTVYAGHALATFRLTRKPWCVSLAKGSVESRPVTGRKTLAVTRIDMTHLHEDRFIKASEPIPSEAAGDLAKAKFVLIGGMGMGSRENTRELQRIAEMIGADFGVTRPVAMHAWAPMHRLIGVSGVTVKADVCIVAGASGAAAFYAGIEKSQFIVAINKNIRAPIITSADVAVIDDYKGVMEALARMMAGRPKMIAAGLRPIQ
jgi:electron transfer flavoprotein alpha subunit